MSTTALLPHGALTDFVAPECEALVEILYQDDDILLINKPSGLLSVSGANPLNWDSVYYRLLHGQEGATPAFPEAKLPHRLDIGTSGIMLVGLHAAATRHLNIQFQQRVIQRRYVAVLEGWLQHDHGQVSAPIAKDKSIFPRVKICHSSGKAATSQYRVLQRLDQPQRTVVEFTPLTGRTHQLRIHSLLAGHPILGCELYSSAHSEQMAERLLLHAKDVYFQHPRSGEHIHAQSPCPFYL